METDGKEIFQSEDVAIEMKTWFKNNHIIVKKEKIQENTKDNSLQRDIFLVKFVNNLFMWKTMENFK